MPNNEKRNKNERNERLYGHRHKPSLFNFKQYISYGRLKMRLEYRVVSPRLGNFTDSKSELQRVKPKFLPM